MASPGERKADSETPSLCLDLDKFETNLARIAHHIRDSGKNWRPRANSHRCSEIALRQIREGAIGITCAKVSEAEVFAAMGIRDILIAHLPVGPHRIRRIAELCKSTNLIVTCDHYVQAEPLSAECRRQGVQCRVLVDMNVGMDRAGVRPGRDAIELARGIEHLAGLKLVGIMGHVEHLDPTTNADVRRRQFDAAMGILSHARAVFHRIGLCCGIVGASGAGSFQQALACECLTEIQAGGPIFGEQVDSSVVDTQLPDTIESHSALTVLTTVVSRPGFERAVLDAGRCVMTAEFHPPVVKDWSDAKIVNQSAEYFVLELGPESRELRIGDQVELVVDPARPTVILHDEYHCYRNDRIDSIWPILPRGKMV